MCSECTWWSFMFCLGIIVVMLLAADDYAMAHSLMW